ncbi:MAG TPA: hypothetical protein VJ807_01080 [Gaiellaceae bacterium]|nr:hypothetical protein [Gaiellaceae bacterium]
MRLLLALVVVGALSCAAAAARPAGTAPVTCTSIITPAGSYEWRPKRVVLGLVAAPPRYIPQTVRGEGRWPYWSKAGLVVRADSPPVVVRVPPAWWDRVAITWGDGGPAAALRIDSCPPSSSLGPWNPYSGSFLLKTRSACVPLTFRAGEQSATVRFGVGKRCA